MENPFEEKLVEVIEDGRIAKVPEFYAKREGLPVLRRVMAAPKVSTGPVPVSSKISLAQIGDRGMVVDNFRKPDWKEKQVLTELVDNFHWRIRVERRRKGFTRKQLAEKICEREDVLKMVENGVLPIKDFVLINKIQGALGINLRKDQKDYSRSAREMIKEGDEIEKKKEEVREVRAKEKEESKIYGDDIEILGDF